jgi:hypothetical protein
MFGYFPNGDITSTQCLKLEVREIGHVKANVLECLQTDVHSRELGASVASHLSARPPDKFLML